MSHPDEQTVTNTMQSTLNQIRTKGINRGGLYGFFVKGEAIAGTLDDSFASATHTSNSPSLIDTPPTSASEVDAPKPTATMSDKITKRKRGDDDSASVEKAAKKARKEACKQKQESDAPAEPAHDSDTAVRLAKKARKETRKKVRKQNASTKGESSAIVTPSEPAQDDAAEKLAKKARKEARRQKAGTGTPAMPAQDREGAVEKLSKKARKEARRARKAEEAGTQDHADTPSDAPQTVSITKQEHGTQSTKKLRVKQKTAPPADSITRSKSVQDPAIEKEQASKVCKAARREARKAAKASSGNGKLPVKHAEN